VLIVGLGNPGEKYDRTRHNLGFMAADALVSEFGGSFKEGFKGLYAEVFINGVKHFVLKPQTYMNLSGESVQPFCAFYKIPVQDIVVVHDDLDMEFGKLKIRKGGSSGGHNGIKSIVQHMGTEDFTRVKIGIGKDRRKEVVGHVLGRFAPDEAEKLDELINFSVKAIVSIVNDGLLKAMNAYNNRNI
jgi:PTH1 family peptidyl-tRNA hydrolase